ncbi:MAG: hypothetical protein K2H66_05745 [Oscillospiraceae bacterium]|nr:hypothetical protein [Oscillospiraceae bacterium]
MILFDYGGTLLYESNLNPYISENPHNVTPKKFNSICAHRLTASYVK